MLREIGQRDGGEGSFRSTLVTCDVKVLLKIEAARYDTATTLLSNAKDQRHNLEWNMKAELVWSSRQIPKPSYPCFSWRHFMCKRGRPRHQKKPAGLTGVTADAQGTMQQRMPYLSGPYLSGMSTKSYSRASITIVDASERIWNPARCSCRS